MAKGRTYNLGILDPGDLARRIEIVRKDVSVFREGLRELRQKKTDYLYWYEVTKVAPEIADLELFTKEGIERAMPSIDNNIDHVSKALRNAELYLSFLEGERKKAQDLLLDHIVPKARKRPYVLQK
jgi:hypothetical protein